MLSRQSKYILFILTLAMLVSAFAVTCMGSVGFSEDDVGDKESLFVAGNPDLYPIEYYNRMTGKYEGLLPRLYEKISRETGLDFTYIYASPKNQQAYLAENKQVDLVSAYVAGDAVEQYSPETGARICFYQDGKKHEVMIGFTDVCPKESVETILTFLDSLPDDELTAITIGYVMDSHDPTPVHLVVVILLAVVFLTLLILFIVFCKKYVVLQKAVRYREQYDVPTGIYNRSYFQYLLDKKVSLEAKPICYLAYVSLDTDRMKRYYNKDQAEQMARYIAQTLQGAVADGEYCARLGDLSFAYFIRCVNQEMAEERIEAILLQMNAENGILNEDYQIELRAGVYHCTRFYEESSHIIDVAAETYARAQRTEKSYLFASNEVIHADDRYERMQRETAQAIKNGEIMFYLQYIVDVRTNQVCGAEAISRWQHPREGLLMPGDYITLMQQANTISLLDYYIFEKTCKQLEQWGQTEDKKDFFLSCNFDRRTIAEENFFEKIAEIAARYKFDRSKVLLEITEDTLEYNKETAYQNAIRCKNAGFGLGLDDFGSGCTSFATLLDFPITLLKMDRSFVKLLATERGRLLAEGIVSMSRSVGYEVLFEGIETEEQCEIVKKMGVDYVQGYLFSRVVPYIEAARTLSSLSSRLNGKEAEEQFADPEVAAIFDGPLKLFRRVGYSQSFAVKRQQAPAHIVAAYSEIQEKLMSCMGATSKISMVYETISVGKQPIAKLVFMSKALVVCLALPPEEYFGTKYPFKDVSYHKKYQKVPLCLKVTDDKSKENVMELLEVLTSKYGAKRR